MKTDDVKITKFDRDRLHKSIMTVCFSARRPIGQARATASSVCDDVVEWIKSRPDITSHDLRRVAAISLENYDPEAAYLYSQHHITM